METSPAVPEPARSAGSTREVVLTFLRLGVIAFGGPAAHIALMREELVRRKQWVSDERFVDLMGATNLIPGPNSTELAIHLGHDRARWRGLVAAGVCFIVPAALMVGALAWAYVRYGRTPAVEGLLYGIVPVVLAIIVWAVVPLTRTAVKGWWGWLLALAALGAYLAGVPELLVLAAGAVAGALRHGAVDAATRWRTQGPGALAFPLVAPVIAGRPGSEDLTTLFWTILKIGSVLYGSGYVLLAFLEGDFVDRLGWLTQQQLLDAVSIGQVTPGPVFTTATFVGYLVAGFWGAVLATVAIFLPSFVFVGLLTRLTGWLRSRAWTSSLLDAVNAVSLALMVGVALQLARGALTDVLTVTLLAAGLVALWRTRLNSAWLIGGGAVVGVVHQFAG
ncbi:chromate efflux transporter [Nocardioides sp.]|uniref:chromate efflux transporter n=1 Tax=Nocardioides sp. TaxID=35761 RepID=UPI0035155AF2